MASLTDNDKLG